MGINKDKKKVTLSWAQKRRLKGTPYESLVESLFDEVEEVSDFSRSNRKGPDYNLTAFLMRDLERIARLEEMFINGIDNLIDFNHHGPLIERQEKINSKLKHELIEIFFNENSTFLDNLRNLYHESF